MTEQAAGTSDAAVSEHDVEVLREAVTMALYISLSLLAVTVAMPTAAHESGAATALTIALASIGLILAHQVAFRISSRLTGRGVLGPLVPRLMRAQWAGGLAVTVVAALPVLLLGGDALVISELLLLGFTAVVGYLAARSVPVSRARVLAYVVLVVAVVLAVLLVKSLVGH